jgi:hypothetical protein
LGWGKVALNGPHVSSFIFGLLVKYVFIVMGIEYTFTKITGLQLELNLVAFKI